MTVVKYVSFPVSRVRFLAEPDAERPLLVTGSWMEETNRLCLWQLGVSQDPDDEPTLLAESPHCGDILDIRCNAVFNQILVSSSTGLISLYRAEQKLTASGVNRLVLLASWPDLMLSACGALALRHNGVALAAGDDGSIAVFNLDDPKKGRACIMTEGHDCCGISAIELIDHNSLASVNRMGQLKLWDLRGPMDKPQWAIYIAGDPSPLHTVHRHPGQPHIVATGGDRGAAHVWDLRQERYPLTELNASPEGGPVWQVAFHSSQPEHLFLATEMAGLLRCSVKGGDSTWSSASGPKQKLELVSFLGNELTPGVHTFDLTRDKLVAGTDHAGLYTLACL